MSSTWTQPNASTCLLLSVTFPSVVEERQLLPHKRSLYYSPLPCRFQKRHKNKQQNANMKKKAEEVRSSSDCADGNRQTCARRFSFSSAKLALKTMQQWKVRAGWSAQLGLHNSDAMVSGDWPTDGLETTGDTRLLLPLQFLVLPHASKWYDPRQHCRGSRALCRSNLRTCFSSHQDSAATQSLLVRVLLSSAHVAVPVVVQLLHAQKTASTLH